MAFVRKFEQDEVDSQLKVVGKARFSRLCFLGRLIKNGCIIWLISGRSLFI